MNRRAWLYPFFALAGASKIAVGICLSGWPERFNRV
jgi:hypothetical protein